MGAVMAEFYFHLSADGSRLHGKMVARHPDGDLTNVAYFDRCDGGRLGLDEINEASKIMKAEFQDELDQELAGQADDQEWSNEQWAP